MPSPARAARWKVPGNPGADGGLGYHGENVEEYRRRYQIKSGDDLKDWKALIALCKTLNETPPDKLEKALEPILDIDGVLWFLALDNALINGDGYWTRASDYSIYRDARGKFHVIPHDTNETFGPAMMFGPGGFGPGGPGRGGFGRGPGGRRRRRGARAADRADRAARQAKGGFGGRGGPRPANVDLDPLVGLNDTRKPLRSRLLAVPSLRARYLEHVRTIAEDWLDWNRLGPVVARYRTLIDKDVEDDTRKLSSTAAYLKAVADAPEDPAAVPGPGPGRGPSMGLRTFADRRRKYLLSYPEIQKLAPTRRSAEGGGK